LKCEVQSKSYIGAKSSCECGPVQLDPEFQGLLHNFMQNLKNSKNSIVYKVYEADAEMYIVVNIEKLKIKNAKKKTVEKETWTEVTKIVLSDDDPKSFSLQLSGKFKLHQFRVSKMRDREIITLLIRALYMRHVCTSYDPKSLYLRSLIAAAAQKARFAFAPQGNFDDVQKPNKLLVDKLRHISSQQVREDSVSTTLNYHIPKAIEISSDAPSVNNTSDNILSVTPRTDVTENVNVAFGDASFDLFGDLGGVLAESAASDMEEVGSGSEAEEPEAAHKAISGLEISDKPVAQVSAEELNKYASAFTCANECQAKATKKIPIEYQRQKEKEKKEAEADDSDNRIKGTICCQT